MLSFVVWSGLAYNSPNHDHGFVHSTSSVSRLIPSKSTSPLLASDSIIAYKNKMFRSLASSIITLVAILLFASILLFLWSGSEGIKFTRVAFEGDKSTESVLEEARRANMASTEVKDDDETPEPVSQNLGDGPAVVVWINISGFRGDYL